MYCTGISRGEFIRPGKAKPLVGWKPRFGMALSE
jgi:hypothetical protein